MQDDQNELLTILSEIRDELRLRREQEQGMYEISMEKSEQSKEEWQEQNKNLSNSRVMLITMIFVLMMFSFLAGQVSHWFLPVVR